MTLLLMDSCRQPGNVGSQWIAFSPSSADPTKIGTPPLQHYNMDNDRGVTLRYDLGSDEDDVIVCSARIYVNGADSMSNGLNDDWIWRLSEGGAVTRHIYLKLSNADFSIKVNRGTTVLFTSSSGVIPFNSWFFLEFKVTIHDTAGTVQVRVDGVDVINETSVDTRNGGSDGLIDRIEFGSAENNSIQLRVCDIHLINEQGSAPLNDLIGPHTIESLRTDAAGNYTNWTPSAGDNHDAVDDPTEAFHDSDSTYVETTVAERDSYSFENLVSGEDPIAVQAKATARFTGTQQDFNTFLRRSSTDVDGPTETGTTSAYADRALTIWETDPVAAAAWTKANLEATEFGIETT